MARTSEDYLHLFQSLLPKGRFWSRDPNSVLSQFFRGLGEEFVRIETRANVLLQEKDTRYANELLDEHEADYGLPDDCEPTDEFTDGERRQRLNVRLRATGAQDKTYFIELAESLGFPGATITEYTPFWCGLGASGDPCGDQNNLFYWTVNVNVFGDLTYFTAGSSRAGDALAAYPNTDYMVCLIERYKPAHTIVNFNFTGPEFSNEFSNAFNAVNTSSDAYLDGAFDRAFSVAFDVFFGGAFSKDEFSSDFNVPN